MNYILCKIQASDTSYDQNGYIYSEVHIVNSAAIVYKLAYPPYCFDPNILIL